MSALPLARSIAEDRPEPTAPKARIYGRRARGYEQLNVSVPASVKHQLDAWCRDQTLALREAMPYAGNRETRVSMSEVVERLIIEHLERVRGKRELRLAPGRMKPT